MFKYRYAYLSMFQVDSRWTPENHLESSGVHLNSVGECKVLAGRITEQSHTALLLVILIFFV